MIETINIWKRSYDDKYGICILVKVDDGSFNEVLHRIKVQGSDSLIGTLSILTETLHKIELNYKE